MRAGAGIRPAAVLATLPIPTFCAHPGRQRGRLFRRFGIALNSLGLGDRQSVIGVPLYWTGVYPGHEPAAWLVAGAWAAAPTAPRFGRCDLCGGRYLRLACA